jgi:hypothetical protein
VLDRSNLDDIADSAEIGRGMLVDREAGALVFASTRCCAMSWKPATLSLESSAIVDSDLPLRRPEPIREAANPLRLPYSPPATDVPGAEIPINGGQHA